MKSKENIVMMKEVISTYKAPKYAVRPLSKYHHWFPVVRSPKLAGIVGDLMGDGHMQGHPKWRIDYCSNSIKELDRFNGEVHDLFKIKGKIRKCTTNRYNTFNLGINNKPLARLLYVSGVPTGSKVTLSFAIPTWISKNPDCFARFINRLISCEGTVDVKNKYIELRMYKSLDALEGGINFFAMIKEKLEEFFKIVTTNPFLEGRTNIRKDGVRTKGIRLKIKRKMAVINFKRYIDIDDSEKKEKLDKIIEKFSI